MQRVGAAVGQRGNGQRGDRVQAGGGEPDAAQHVDGDGSDQQPDEQADPELADEQQGEVGRRRSRLGQQVDEAEDQQDRHRVIQAGLALERLRELARQRRAAQQREDRRAVGRGQDRSEQQPLLGREAEQRRPRKADDQRGDRRPDGRQAEAAPSTGRRCRSPLVSPPSNRIRASEMTPIVRASR